MRPPSNARTLEREGTKDEQLALAELYLCTGSQLKARSILKRLDRSRFSQKARVEALLWALETDLDAEELSLMQLAKAFLSELPLLEEPVPPDGNGSAVTTTCFQQQECCPPDIMIIFEIRYIKKSIKDGQGQGEQGGPSKG